MTRRRIASRSTLVDTVVDEIRDMILTGEFALEEYLPSRKDLAELFDVGVSTINEAIQVLTTLGLVASRPGKGTWVCSDARQSLVQPEAARGLLGPIDAQMVYEARSVIEVPLTMLAAERASEEDVERIYDALASMEANVDDAEQFVKADYDFHLCVAKAARNQLLTMFYHLSRQLFLDVLLQLVDLPDFKEDGIRLQRAIAQAIEQGDTEKAREAAEVHMSIIKPIFVAHLDKNRLA